MPQAARAGLCDSCRHQRIVRNTRGSVFSLCERSREDADFPRYPRIPVTECRGFERVRGESGGDSGTPGSSKPSL